VKKTITAIALLAIATGCAVRKPLTNAEAMQQVDKMIDQADVDRIVKTLSADDMQGRGIYTPGIDKAATFIEGEFKKAGLVPLAGNNGFRQSWEFANVTPKTSIVSINGKTVAADSLKITTSLASLNWNNSKDVEVVKLTADKDFQKESAAYAKSGKKLLIIADPKFVTAIKGGRRGRITVNDNQALVYVIGNFGDVKSFNVNYTADVKKTAPLFNVAGMIPGKTDEYVVFSGHYDHLGIEKNARKIIQGDSINNGADDDASGTTAMITLAKYYKKLNNNQRTIIFVAFTGEESGDLGSGHFGEGMNPAKAIAMFNIEMIGKAAKWGQNSAFITGFERSNFGTILQKNLTGTTFKFYPDPYPDQHLFTRSDNWALAQYGVPAHTISTDQIPDDKLYHTVKDEYKTLDVANITATIKGIALSSRTIISGQDTPTKITDLSRN